MNGILSPKAAEMMQKKMQEIIQKAQESRRLESSPTRA